MDYENPSARAEKMLEIAEMLQNLKAVYEPIPAGELARVERQQQQKWVAERGDKDVVQSVPPDLMFRVYSL